MQKTVISNHGKCESSKSTTPVPDVHDAIEKRPINITTIPEIAIDSGKNSSFSSDEIQKTTERNNLIMSYRAQDLVGVIHKLRFVTIKPIHFIQKYDKNISVKEMYRIGPKIEEGSFSTVRLAVTKSNHKARAIKSFVYTTIFDKRERIKNEINIHSRLDHPNIINLHAYYEDPSGTHLVLEIVGEKDLQKYIAKNGGRLSESKARSFMRDILRAILYLHTNDIVHRDIKPENFMVDEKNQMLKLIDFGQASELKDGETLSEKQGTPPFMSPELIERKYDKRTDIWSCGVVLFIMLSGQAPFAFDKLEGKNKDSQEIAHQCHIMHDSLKMQGPIWEKISRGARDFV